MANPIQESNSFYAKDLAAWHKWLAENHNLKEFVWLILFKKNSKTPCITLQDAIDEALCFGWIDSKPNKRDAESYYLFFAQRKPKSVWSKINKEKVKRLLAEGRIQKAGLRKIEQAKKDGSWDILNEIEELIMPEDLKTALDKNRKANEYFEAFPPGIKKGIYQWIISAKKTETREKRIETTVQFAAENKRANQWKE
ncbi:MAG: YdeI/OmpD-associated family protein [Flammeovirgaceae bacterium]|jgi:uncharacterized protein YdeI (YjbR/CyaY-like superfamily)|nr:YdeI/OmpD-associated family protein [Flammeovirgaceae bacterium]